MYEYPTRRRRIALALFVFVTAFFALAGVASAEESLQAGEGVMFVPDPVLIAVIIGFLIPLVTGIIVKQEASSGTKTVVSVLLSAFVGVLTYIVDHSGGFNLKDAAVFALITFGAQVGGYYGVWKHTTSESGTVTMKLTKGFGIG